MKPTRRTLGKILRALRENAGMSQTDVARTLGITQPAYSKVEAATVPITFTRLVALADLYDLEASQLLDRVEYSHETLQKAEDAMAAVTA